MKSPEQQFENSFEKQVSVMPAAQKLRLAEQVRAMSRQLIAAGEQPLNPENAKALHFLDVQIDAARTRLGRK